MIKKRNIGREGNMNVHINPKILPFIEERKIVTSSELAEYLEVSWNTADKWLLELALQGKVERIKKSGVNLWLLR